MNPGVQRQVKEETGAPWFSVLGQPGGSSEGHPAVPETDREKIFWVAAFRSRESLGCAGIS